MPVRYYPNHMLLLINYFASIKSNKVLLKDIEFHFIGTGGNLPDADYKIKPFAEKYNLWQSIIYEYPARIPYLDVLVHLNHADGILIIGSTEKHYTPSKVFQAILAKKPIIAWLHKESTACEIIKRLDAGRVLDFDGPSDLGKIENESLSIIEDFRRFIQNYNSVSIDNHILSNYTAKCITKKLVNLVEKTIYHGME